MAKRVKAKRAAAPLRRMGRRLLLDVRVIAEIADAVGRGAFLHVAAEAAGVSRRTLQGWLERGRELEDLADLDERDRLYVELLGAVRQAQASARMKAEATVWKRKPLEWLRFGPGRDRGPEDPGWTKAVGEAPREVRSVAEVLLAQALAQLGLVPEPVGIEASAVSARPDGCLVTPESSCGEDGGD